MHQNRGIKAFYQTLQILLWDSLHPEIATTLLEKAVRFIKVQQILVLFFPTMRMYTDKPSRYAKVLDTLLSVRAPVGSLNIAYENCCIGRGLASIHGKYDNNTFVRYLLKNNRWYFDNINNSGTTFGSITKNLFI